MLRDDPADPHALRVAGFFVGFECDNDVAVRAIALFLVADEVGDPCGRHVFVVARAARVKVAVFLDELERIGGPVRALRLDHVDVGDEEDRLPLAGAAQPGDQIPALRCRFEGLNIGCREARRRESRGHRLRSLVGVPDGGGGVDLEKLAIDVERALLLRIQILGSRRGLHTGWVLPACGVLRVGRVHGTHECGSGEDRKALVHSQYRHGIILRERHESSIMHK